MRAINDWFMTLQGGRQNKVIYTQNTTFQLPADGEKPEPRMNDKNAAHEQDNPISPALPSCLVKEHARGDGYVQGIHVAGHRNLHRRITGDQRGIG